MGKMPLVRSIMLIGAVSALTGFTGGCNNTPQKTPYRPAPVFQGSQNSGSQSSVLQNSTPLPGSTTASPAIPPGAKGNPGGQVSPPGSTGTQPITNYGAAQGSLGNGAPMGDLTGKKEWPTSNAMGNPMTPGGFPAAQDNTIHNVSTSQVGLNPIPAAPKPGDSFNPYGSGLAGAPGAAPMGMRPSLGGDSLKQPSASSLPASMGPTPASNLLPPGPPLFTGTNPAPVNNPPIPAYNLPAPPSGPSSLELPPPMGGTKLPMLPPG
jgi:hypothetical protein